MKHYDEQRAKMKRLEPWTSEAQQRTDAKITIEAKYAICNKT